ncbi:hypothetical protein DND58_30260 [Pseudomonas syringae pv. pisi]|nr:hypothetical protein DND58_30260 [Pseudomonas syringae pv. pisi]
MVRGFYQTITDQNKETLERRQSTNPHLTGFPMWYNSMIQQRLFEIHDDTVDDILVPVEEEINMETGWFLYY